MPANKILPGESMAKSFPKINQAIEDAFEAISKASNADGNSNSALVKAKSVQSQLNAIVRRESDSNVETAQMRVDMNNVEHETANERLVSDFNQLEKNLNENAYFHGLTTTKYRDAGSSTDYYITIIPHKDENGEIVSLKRGFAKDVPNGGVGETARSFANRKNATLTLNASIFNIDTLRLRGVDIYNGVVLNEETDNQTHYIIGIKEDNTLVSYPPGTPAETIINDGCNNALTAFIPLISNGTKVSDAILNGYTGGLDRHPRQVLCQFPNKDIMIFTCEGRTRENLGMLNEEVIRILLSYGVSYAHMLDGGGSSQTIVRGTMINKSIDNSGYAEREVPDFLYIAKEVKYNRDKDIIALNTDIGELAKRVADVLLDVQNKTDFNLGYARLRGANGYNSQGIESWDGESKNTKLFINKDFISFYDYLTESTAFRVMTDGTLSTKKGIFGSFFASPTNITNANSLNDSGMYWAVPSTVNTPDNASSYGIIHFHLGTDAALQIAFPFAPNLPAKRRRKNGGTWESWSNL